MQSFISILCSVALLFSSGAAVGVSTIDRTIENKETIIAERTFNVFQKRMDELKAETFNSLAVNADSSIEIDTISTLYSFSGNEYILVEYKPVGYIIYDESSGTFLESSAVATSPYANAEGKKYYAGPNEYYVATEENGIVSYTHTVYDETIENEDISAYVQACMELDSLLVENPNTAVLSYINEGTDLSNSASTLSTTVNGITYVKNYSFFMNLSDCGYTTVSGSGICGYIAAGILLTYDAAINHYPTVSSPSDYSRNSSGAYSISTTLPKDLYNVGVGLGYGTDTTSVAIHYTVEKYLKDKHMTASHTSLYSPIASNSNIRKKIDNDRPVIWFGNVFSNSYNSKTNINHAVVVYGYEYSFWSGTGFVAHFGWTNATAVAFSGIMGSMYTYSISSIDTLD